MKLNIVYIKTNRFIVFYNLNKKAMFLSKIVFKEQKFENEKILSKIWDVLWTCLGFPMLVVDSSNFVTLSLLLNYPFFNIFPISSAHISPFLFQSHPYSLLSLLLDLSLIPFHLTLAISSSFFVFLCHFHVIYLCLFEYETTLPQSLLHTKFFAYLTPNTFWSIF